MDSNKNQVLKKPSKSYMETVLFLPKWQKEKGLSHDELKKVFEENERNFHEDYLKTKNDYEQYGSTYKGRHVGKEAEYDIKLTRKLAEAATYVKEEFLTQERQPTRKVNKIPRSFLDVQSPFGFKKEDRELVAKGQLLTSIEDYTDHSKYTETKNTVLQKKLFLLFPGDLLQSYLSGRSTTLIPQSLYGLDGDEILPSTSLSSGYGSSYESSSHNSHTSSPSSYGSMSISPSPIESIETIRSEYLQKRKRLLDKYAEKQRKIGLEQDNYMQKDLNEANTIKMNKGLQEIDDLFARKMLKFKGIKTTDMLGAEVRLSDSDDDNNFNVIPSDEKSIILKHIEAEKQDLVNYYDQNILPPCIPFVDIPEYTVSPAERPYADSYEEPKEEIILTQEEKINNILEEYKRTREAAINDYVEAWQKVESQNNVFTIRDKERTDRTNFNVKISDLEETYARKLLNANGFSTTDTHGNEITVGDSIAFGLVTPEEEAKIVATVREQKHHLQFYFEQECPSVLKHLKTRL
jgi:hypothetical protein